MEVLLMHKKTEIIEQIKILLAMLENTMTEEIKPAVTEPAIPILLTIQECTEMIEGLKPNTVRQLVKQDKIRYIRAGEGSRGKILVNKDSLIGYLQSVMQY
jgi:hypothetical protein